MQRTVAFVQGQDYLRLQPSHTHHASDMYCRRLLKRVVVCRMVGLATPVGPLVLNYIDDGAWGHDTSILPSPPLIGVLVGGLNSWCIPPTGRVWSEGGVGAGKVPFAQSLQADRIQIKVFVAYREA